MVKNVICFILLFFFTFTSLAKTETEYWAEVIEKSKAVVIGQYHEISENSYEFRVKYGWGEEVATTINHTSLGYVDTNEDLMVFFSNGKSWFLQITEEIKYSEAGVPYNLLGSPEWGVTDDGQISHY